MRRQISTLRTFPIRVEIQPPGQLGAVGALFSDLQLPIGRQSGEDLVVLPSKCSLDLSASCLVTCTVLSSCSGGA